MTHSGPDSARDPVGAAAGGGVSPCPPRVASIARAADIAAAIGIALLSLGAAAMLLLAIFAPQEAEAMLREELAPMRLPERLDHAAVLLVFVLDQMTTLVGLIALALVRRLFTGYRRGEIFAPAAATRLGRLGWMVLALAPVSILSQSLAVLAATWANPPGQRQLTIDIADSDIYAVVIGLAIVAMARVMGEAARMAEENAGFV